MKILPAILLLLACAPSAAQTSPPPGLGPRHQRLGTSSTASVLVIIGDDVGWSERAYIPSLDQIAAVGVTFTRFVTFPVCSPTRQAALSGRLPRREGIGDVVNAHNTQTGASPPPDNSQVIIPEALIPGVETALFGKWHLGRLAKTGRVDLLALTESGPFGSGFTRWRAGNPNSIAQGPMSSGYFDWYRVDDSQVTQGATTYATAAQRDEFLAWWGAISGRKFAWLAFNAAHAPYDTPPGYSPSLTTRAQYLDVVDYLDGALDAVLAAVDLSSTYVVYFGDNGTPDDARLVGSPIGAWKGSTFGHDSTFGGGVCTPLIVAGPGITPGITSSRLVQATDLYATVLELLGAEARGGDDSLSFANSLGSWTGTPARTWVFTERYDVPQAGPGAPQPPGYDDAAVIEANWKLRITDDDGDGPGGKVERVYSLLADPFEVNPLDPNDPALAVIVARLRAEMNSVPTRAPLMTARGPVGSDWRGDG